MLKPHNFPENAVIFFKTKILEILCKSQNLSFNLKSGIFVELKWNKCLSMRGKNHPPAKVRQEKWKSYSAANVEYDKPSAPVQRLIMEILTESFSTSVSTLC